MNVLRKLKRDTASYLQKKDKDIIADFMNNMREYLKYGELFFLMKGYVEQRDEHIANLDKLKDLNLDMINEEIDLEEAGVSKKEYE
jgi:hypothetical protein